MQLHSTKMGTHEIVLDNTRQISTFLMRDGTCIGVKSYERGVRICLYVLEDERRLPGEWKDAARVTKTELEFKLRAAVRCTALA